MHAPIQPLIDPSPPHSLEAERGVIGSLMLDARRCDDVSPTLLPDEFLSPAYRKLYVAILAMHSEGIAFDVALLVERLKSNGELDSIGGLPALLDIAESQPTATNAIWYAERVRSFAIRRETIAAANEARSDAQDLTADPNEVVTRADARFAAISDRRTASDAGDMASAMQETVDEIGRRMSGEAMKGVATPWYELNRLIGCFRDGEFYVLAARPRMGKTSIGINAAEHVAANLDKGVLFVSLEMSRGELCERILSARSGINGETIRDGSLTQADRRKLIEAQDDTSSMPLFIDDAPGRTLHDIGSRARSMHRQGKLRLLIVDHLGLVAPDNPRDNRQEQVSKISRGLKLLAKQLKIPVLALAQLNRENDKRPDHKPRLSDIRESGSIEQDAGIVMFIHREEEYRPTDYDLRGKAELIVAKNRSGRTGTVPLAWNAATTSFASTSREWTGLD